MCKYCNFLDNETSIIQYISDNNEKYIRSIFKKFTIIYPRNKYTKPCSDCGFYSGYDEHLIVNSDNTYIKIDLKPNDIFIHSSKNFKYLFNMYKYSDVILERKDIDKKYIDIYLNSPAIKFDEPIYKLHYIKPLGVRNIIEYIWQYTDKERLIEDEDDCCCGHSKYIYTIAKTKGGKYLLSSQFMGCASYDESDADIRYFISMEELIKNMPEHIKSIFDKDYNKCIKEGHQENLINKKCVEEIRTLLNNYLINDISNIIIQYLDIKICLEC